MHLRSAALRLDAAGRTAAANPALHAIITGPVGAVLGDMSTGNEGAVFFTQAQREAVLCGVFKNYGDAPARKRTAFDTNCGSTTRLELLATLFPQSKTICCVRPIPWLLDSIKRLVLRRNAKVIDHKTLSASGVDAR